MMKKYKLKLYIAGKTPKSELAIANLKELCDKDLKGLYELQVIDVLENPQLAENEKILATPTLIKELPPPIKRIIGDLTNVARVLIGLDIVPVTDMKHEEGGK
jgi:circadian clock protein KaiB